MYPKNTACPENTAYPKSTAHPGTVRRRWTVAGAVATLVLAATPAAAGATPADPAERGMAPAAMRPVPASATQAAQAARAVGLLDTTLVSSDGQKISAAEILAARPDAATAKGSAGANGSAAGARSTADKRAPARGHSLAAVPTPRVQDTATGTFPSSAIVYLETDKWRCSGFMLAPDTVVTAAHCLYDFFNGGVWASTYTIWPGRSDNFVPFGSCSGFMGGYGWIPTAYQQTGAIDYDFAAINLDCTVGNQSGWLGWWYDGADLTGQDFYGEGYPADKPGITMWWGHGPIRSGTNTMFEFGIEVAGGMSGGPVYHWRPAGSAHCAGWCVAGIVTNGAGSAEGGGGGSRLHPDAYNLINWVIAEP